MREQLKLLISSGLFKDAKDIFVNMKEDEARDCLMELGYEKQSIAVYGFMCSILCENENADLHYLASEILTMPLCHLDGAYVAGLYHGKRALQLDPDDVELKEYLLLFYNISDKLINKEEASDLARDILERKPGSKVALEVLK